MRDVELVIRGRKRPLELRGTYSPVVQVLFKGELQGLKRLEFNTRKAEWPTTRFVSNRGRASIQDEALLRLGAPAAGAAYSAAAVQLRFRVL